MNDRLIRLEKIKTKCERKIAAVEREAISLADCYQGPLAQAVAGWKTTLAAIELAEWGDNPRLTEAIIEAWPEELL